MILGAVISDTSSRATFNVGNDTAADVHTIQWFLERILPVPGPGRVVSINKPYTDPQTGRKGMPGQGFETVKEAANHIAYWLGRDFQAQGRAQTDFYHTMSVQSGAVRGQTRSGRTMLKLSRNQNNAVALKAFFLDLDTKPDRGGYASKQEALGALIPLVRDGRVPAPSIVVDSGNGLHVYWTLNRELAAKDWLTLSEGFGNYLWQEGIKLHLGDSFYTDSARLLRPPGTWNCKDPNNPIKTRIVGTPRADDYDPAIFQRYVGTPRPNQTATVARLPLPAKAGTPNVPASPNASLGNLAPIGPAISNDMAAGISEAKAQPVDMAKVVENCEVLKDVLARGGAGDPEPFWRDVLYAASFAPDGREWAHKFSSGDPRYKPDETDAKYDTILAQRAQRDSGWPQCATLNKHSPACSQCAFAGKVRTPMHTGKDDSDLPEGYYRQGGTIWKNVQTGGANNADFIPMCVFPYGIRDAFIESTSEGPTLNAELHIRHSAPSRIRLPLAAVNTWREGISKLFGHYGITLSKRRSAEAQEFFVSYIQHLQSIAAMSAKRDAFGWTKTRQGKSGFAFGGRIICADGSSEPIASQDSTLESNFAPAGTLAEWKRAADFVVGSGRVELATIIAAAFAAPLVRFTGQSGLLVSAYSPSSGVQKSSAMQVGMAVWGHPVRAMNRIDDTGNSVGHKLGALRHLPVMWDELKTDDEKQSFAKLAFVLTQGSEKARLTSDITQRHSGSWATMLVSASNFSVQDEMVKRARNTTAGLNRVLEFVVRPAPPGGLVSIGTASLVLDALKTNHGKAGEVYARALVREEAKMAARIEALVRAFEGMLGSVPEERFWLFSAATILLGAAIARAEGLVDFDLPAMRLFLCDVIREQRRAKSAQAVDVTQAEFVADVVVRYIAHTRRFNACLETDYMAMPGHRGRHQPLQLLMPSEEARRALRSPVVHLSRLGGLARISRHEFLQWLSDEKLPQRAVVDGLTQHGGLVQHRITWAAGTEWSSGQTHVYDIVLSAGNGPQHGIGNLFDWGAQPVAGQQIQGVTTHAAP